MLAIKTENLTKKYKDKVAVNSINLSINKGEIYGLLGVNAVYSRRKRCGQVYNNKNAFVSD